jgi:hypothetical protein
MQWHASRVSALLPVPGDTVNYVTPLKVVEVQADMTDAQLIAATRGTNAILVDAGFTPNVSGPGVDMRGTSASGYLDARADTAAAGMSGDATLSKVWVRCAFFDRKLRSMMPLVPTPAHFKRAFLSGVCLSYWLPL